jgi:hypothetical protein
VEDSLSLSLSIYIYNQKYIVVVACILLGRGVRVNESSIIITVPRLSIKALFLHPFSNAILSLNMPVERNDIVTLPL